MKYIYGPVASWRLGRSLGIDLISQDKRCTFDCVYCQIGRTANFTDKRRIFVPTKSVLKEFDALPEFNADFITFSGCGEPTLAKNLGEVIRGTKKRTSIPVAVLTNSSLMRKKSVRSELGLADLVSAKLDAPDQKTLEVVNAPMRGVSFKKIVDGIKKFNSEFPGKLALQVMFVPENKDKAAEIADLVKDIKPLEVHINTPLRPCGSSPVSKAALKNIGKMFRPLKVFCVYDAKKIKVSPLDKKAVKMRRP